MAVVNLFCPSKVGVVLHLSPTPIKTLVISGPSVLHSLSSNIGFQRLLLQTIAYHVVEIGFFPEGLTYGTISSATLIFIYISYGANPFYQFANWIINTSAIILTFKNATLRNQSFWAFTASASVLRPALETITKVYKNTSYFILFLPNSVKLLGPNSHNYSCRHHHS